MDALISDNAAVSIMETRKATERLVHALWCSINKDFAASKCHVLILCFLSTINLQMFSLSSQINLIWSQSWSPTLISVMPFNILCHGCWHITFYNIGYES